MCLAISAELVGLDRDALQELARRLNTDGWEFDVSKPARWFRAPLLLYFNGGPCACECLSADGLPRRILRGSGRHRVGTGAAGSLDPANERQPRCEVRAHRQTRTASDILRPILVGAFLVLGQAWSTPERADYDLVQ